VTGFVDVYITPDGLDADSLPDVVGSRGQVPSNGDNTFVITLHCFQD